MFILDETTTKLFRNKLNTSPFSIIPDFLVNIFILIVLVKIDNSTGTEYSGVLMILGIIIWIAYAIFYTNLVIIKYKASYFHMLKDVLNKRINKYLNNTNIDDKDVSDYDKAKDYRERKIELVEELLKPYEDLKSVLSSILTSVIASFIVSVTIVIVNNWKLVDSNNNLDYFVGIFIVLLLIVVGIHCIFIFTDTKLRYYYYKALRDIKLECI